MACVVWPKTFIDSRRDQNFRKSAKDLFKMGDDTTFITHNDYIKNLSFVGNRPHNIDQLIDNVYQNIENLL